MHDSPPNAATPRFRRIATAGALILLASAWLALHHGWYARARIVDTPTYENYGDAMSNGLVPYRDFGLEYPPAALPVFALPAILTPIEGDQARYQVWLELEMFLCGAAAIVLAAAVLGRDGAGAQRTALALGFLAAAPLLLGNVILSRFDLWPAMLTVGALAGIMAGRPRLGAAVLGVAFAAKLYPGVLLPIALAWSWKRRGGGRREAIAVGAAFAAAAGLCFLPFVVASPHGVVAALERQTGRPLQIESLASGLLLVAHALGALPLAVANGFGSQNLVGPGTPWLAPATTAVQLAAIVAVWAWFARGPADADRLLRGWAAAVCAFVAFGKVFSPQYLIWLLPLVPLIRGRRGLRATALFAAALVLTQLWFPDRYWVLARDLGRPESFLVLARDLAVVALLVVLLARAPEPAPVAAGAPSS